METYLPPLLLAAPRHRKWSEFGVNNMENMDPSSLVSMVQAAGGGVMVWGIFSWHTLGPLVLIDHCCNTTAYLSIVADHQIILNTTNIYVLERNSY
uniref:Uncharacterized protein n=1 Tax=Denticeps clupeoides TaxID=299321 RepID=A0AAY4CR11_9TELE